MYLVLTLICYLRLVEIWSGLDTSIISLPKVRRLRLQRWIKKRAEKKCRQKYQPPRINERQTEKDSRSNTLHLRAKAVIDNLTFDFRPFTVFKQYDRPGDPRRRQILMDLQAELKNRMDNYHRYTNIKLDESRWLDPNDEIAVALIRLRSIYNNDLQTYEEIDYHLDKYRILQSTTVQKQLKARGRLVAPKFGTIPYAAHAFSLRGIESINDKNSSNLRKILQRHLIQMESLCLTEDAMKTAMTLCRRAKIRQVLQSSARLYSAQTILNLDIIGIANQSNLVR